MSNISNIYKLFDQSIESFSKEEVYSFFSAYPESFKNSKDFLKQYESDPQIIERQLLNHILKENNIENIPEYLSLYRKKLSAECISSNDESLIVVDELLTFSELSFFSTIFSLIINHQNDNFERCFKNFIVLLDLQGKRKRIGTFNLDEHKRIMSLPEEIMNLVMDVYWCVWTFIIGHEIFHLHSNSVMNARSEEFCADEYGYQILLKMIQAQKEQRIPNQLCVYHEDMYLVPIMLFEYFRLVDEYRELCGFPALSLEDFSPQKRIAHIFDLFDECIPESFDTQKGNDLLNLFLDAVDALEEQMKVKHQLGKLDQIMFS